MSNVVNKSGELANRAQSHSHRYLPIEADDALREAIENDHSISPEHLTTVADLERLLNSDAEKDRVYPSGLNAERRMALNDFLSTAIREIREKYATVAGIVDVLSLEMLDILGRYGKGQLSSKRLPINQGRRMKRRFMDSIRWCGL
jgi:hypothetical protein